MNQRKLLGDALGNTDLTSKLPDGMSSRGKLMSGADLLAETLGKVDDKLANWMSSLEKSTLATNASVMATNTRTLGDHLQAATAQEMASLGVRQIRTAEEVIAVESRRAEIIARANEKAFDLERDAKDRLALAGKTGLDRTLAENDLRFKHYREELVDTSSRSDFGGIGAAFLPAKTAVSDFSGALAEATRRLAGFPGSGGPGGAPGRALDAVGPFYPAPFTGSAGPVSDHERTMVDMLVRVGFTNRAADAGFVGGMAGESSTALDPLAHNASGHRGIMQWEGSRFAGASAFGDPNAFLSQAQLVIRELLTSESAAGAMLRNATTIQGGLAANFRAERPSQAEMASSYGARLAYGTALGADLAGLTPRSLGAPSLTIHGGAPAGSLAATAAAAASARLPSDSALGVKLDTAGPVGRAHNTIAAADKIDATTVPIDRANTSLKNQIALLDTQRDTFGLNRAAVEGATRAQELWNTLVSNSAAPVGRLTDQVGAAADRVRLYGSEVEKAAAAQEAEHLREHNIMDVTDTLRGGLSSSISGGLTAAAHGQGFGNAFRRGLSSLGDQLISHGVSMLTGSLLGQQGSFGGILGSFFGGSHATGGLIMGPGTGKSDSILARVSTGEFVMQDAAVRHYGHDIMHRLNNLSLPRFAEGGLVQAHETHMVTMPHTASVMAPTHEGGWAGARGGNHTFNFGDTHIHPVGGSQFTQEQIGQISGQVEQGNQRTMENIVRNLPQIQRDSAQY